jgi:hypothetical protein
VVEDQRHEQIPDERIDHVHRLKALDHIQAERMRDARQERQQRPGACGD